MPKPVLRNPFSPSLFTTDPVVVSLERLTMINAAIDVAASDSAFAAKLKEAIAFILRATKSTVPTISSLTPNSAQLGSASFTLSVKGTGFDPQSKIYWNNVEEPTTFVSVTELTTGVDMSTAQVAMTIPVQVQNPSGAVTNVSNFSLVAAPPSLLSTPPVKPVVPVIPPTVKTPPVTPLPSIVEKKEE